MPVPVHLNHHISVDSNGKATVTNQGISSPGVPITQLQNGDKVTFTSDDPTTVIRYKQFSSALPSKTQSGTPFAALPPGTPHNVATGVMAATQFTVTQPCDFSSHFIFECGRMINNVFSEWGAPTGVTPGGSTPGPND